MNKKYSIKINSLNSFEEEHTNYIVQQHPLDRIKETVQLILRIYEFDKNKPKNNRIYIDYVKNI